MNKETKHEIRKIDILGIKVCTCDKKSQIAEVEELLQTNTSHYITYTNTHVVVTAQKNSKLKDAVNNADIVSPDGMPLVYIGKKRGYKLEKCSGPDMIYNFFEISNQLGYTNYFYGSTIETLNKLVEILHEKYPNLIIAGMFSPPFRELTEEEDNSIICEINELSPDFIWIGLGAPKQEIWMYEHKNSINRGIMFGVGAAYDFVTGNVQRAPEWMQNTGFEWLYRLIKEPRRLWKRYFVTNTLFIVYLVKDHFQKRILKKEKRVYEQITRRNDSNT